MKCFPLKSCKHCGLRKMNSCTCPGKQFLRAILKKDEEKDFPEWCPLPDCACPVAAMEQVRG
jgi:hypothetical protein